MLKRIMINTMAVCSLAVASAAFAQNAPSTALTYEMAQKAMEAAVAEAKANNWNLTIVVADHTGLPVMLHRMDGAFPRSYDIALSKVKVVTETGLSSGEYGQKLQAGEIEEVEGGVTFAGGVPVVVNGERIGAVTSSGARGSEDEQVSLAGAAAITD